MDGGIVVVAILSATTRGGNEDLPLFFMANFYGKTRGFLLAKHLSDAFFNPNPNGENPQGFGPDFTLALG